MFTQERVSARNSVISSDTHGLSYLCSLCVGDALPITGEQSVIPRERVQASAPAAAAAAVAFLY